MTLYSVSMPAGDQIRIAWWGGPSHGVTPRLSQVLETLAYRLNVAKPVDEQQPVWGDLTVAELDERISSLVNQGYELGAIKLLRRHRGMSLVEARQFVDALSGAAACWQVNA